MENNKENYFRVLKDAASHTEFTRRVNWLNISSFIVGLLAKGVSFADFLGWNAEQPELCKAAGVSRDKGTFYAYVRTHDLIRQFADRAELSMAEFVTRVLPDFNYTELDRALNEKTLKRIDEGQRAAYVGRVEEALLTGELTKARAAEIKADFGLVKVKKASAADPVPNQNTETPVTVTPPTKLPQGPDPIPAVVAEFIAGADNIQLNQLMDMIARREQELDKEAGVA